MVGEKRYMKNIGQEKSKLTMEMDDLTNYHALGLFKKSKEEQEYVTNGMYEAWKSAIIEMEELFPNDNIKSIYMDNIKELEKHFLLKEDYEMVYLLNKTKNRLNYELPM